MWSGDGDKTFLWMVAGKGVAVIKSCDLKNIKKCNRVHLHIVFVLLYVLCVLLCQCSFVCVHHLIFYVCVTCYDLDVTMRRHYK